MMATLKSEFRKLLTVRSTYFLTGFVWLVVAFVQFYIIGYRASATNLHDPQFILSNIVGATALVGLIGAVIGILLLAHEYRYNTIMYTLTAANSRTKVLASKFIVITLYALVLALVADGLGIGLIQAGVAVHGHTLSSQNLQLAKALGETVFYVWSYAIIGLLLSALIRNLVGSIVVIFVAPTIEQLLGLLLKHNMNYLPFHAVENSLTVGQKVVAGFSEGKSITIVLVYLVVGWLVAWFLFLKRDAN